VEFGAAPPRKRKRAPRLLPPLAFAIALMAEGCGGGTGAVADPGTTVALAPTLPPSASPSPSPSAAPSTPAPVDPGLLPQTHVLPNTNDPMFQAGARDLWQAIVTDNPATAQPFFFPKSAYLQVKAISNPAADYQNRLILWYRLDIEAAHALLGTHAAEAKLVSVTVPTAQAEWIVPGVEYNKGSYYRVFGTRLTYQIGGKTASFGIFSLISWRGEWYVVHVGPSTRSSNRGIVYQYSG
jgi:hypothetical protein